jgi:hypothetical protein
MNANGRATAAVCRVPDEAEAPPDESTVRAAPERQYALVYDVLGPATLAAWYGDDRCAAT